jgi:type IV secretory pathway VirB3-like protein
LAGVTSDGCPPFIFGVTIEFVDDDGVFVVVVVVAVGDDDDVAVPPLIVVLVLALPLSGGGIGLP